MAAVLQCAVELVDSVCPEGQAVWIEIATLTPDMIAPLLGHTVILMAIAAGIQIMVAAIRS